MAKYLYHTYHPIDFNYTRCCSKKYSFTPFMVDFMLYHTLKILHIMGAMLLLTSMGYSLKLWITQKSIQPQNTMVQNLQKQTWLLVIPFAVFQLATGFTMISLNRYDLSEFWIKGSIGGFIVLIASWFSFLCALTKSQQSSKYHSRYDILPIIMLVTSGMTLLIMIFLMANKIP
jgi:uncharacterized membrane protein